MSSNLAIKILAQCLKVVWGTGKRFQINPCQLCRVLTPVTRDGKFKTPVTQDGKFKTFFKWLYLLLLTFFYQENLFICLWRSKYLESLEVKRNKKIPSLFIVGTPKTMNISTISVNLQHLFTFVSMQHFTFIFCIAGFNRTCVNIFTLCLHAAMLLLILFFNRHW